MQMTIFLDVEEARFLNEVIPATSPVRGAIARALRIRECWGINRLEVAIECDDMDALDLLQYAEAYWPNAAADIRGAFRSANLRQVGLPRNGRVGWSN